MQEGTLVRWLKSEDDVVTMGELIAEIETDKAVVEIEATSAGTVLKLLVDEGTTVPVGEAIAVIGEVGEDVDVEFIDAKEKSDIDTNENNGKVNVGTTETSSINGAEITTSDVERVPTGEIKASPIARKIASEQNIDLSMITGSGPGGRITKNDVMQAVEIIADTSASVPSSSTDIIEPQLKTSPSQAIQHNFVPLNKMRSQIARVTVASKTNAPHFYVSVEVEMTKLMNIRSQLNETLKDQGIKVSVNDFMIRAAVETLKNFPKFNSSFIDEGIKFNNDINIGIAIATEDGLIVPAVTGCQNKTIVEIAQSTKDLIERSQGGKLTPNEYTGATFSISNLGMFDVDNFVAIILPPQAAMMAVGSVKPRPVVKDNEIVIEETMNITLSSDHRVVDGAEGAKFVGELKKVLESPLLLILNKLNHFYWLDDFCLIINKSPSKMDTLAFSFKTMLLIPLV